MANKRSKSKTRKTTKPRQPRGVIPLPDAGGRATRARGLVPLPEQDVLGRGLVAESPLRDLSIDHIRPDPNQGRWILPPQIRDRFVAKEIDAAEALRLWRASVELELKASKKAPSEIPEARKLAEIEALARSIAAGGQVNPITVVREREYWQIETGERRFWAHVFRVTVDLDESARTVPAIVRQKLDPFRQAVENLHAAPLNATATARTIARLIMGLTENPAHGQDFEKVLTWADYRAIAQARVPHKGWDKIAQAMGKNSNYLDRQRALLLLPDEALAIADRNDLNERQLRPVVELKEPQAQNRVVELIAELGLSSADSEWLCRQPDLKVAERTLRSRLTAEEMNVPPPRARFAPEETLFKRVNTLIRLTESVAKGGKSPAEALAEQYVAERGEQAEAELRTLISMLEDTVANIEKRQAATEAENLAHGQDFPPEQEPSSE